MPPVRGGSGGSGGSSAGIFRFGIAMGGTLLEAPEEVVEEGGAAAGNRWESDSRAVLFARGKGALTVSFLESPGALGGPRAEDMVPT